MRIMIAIAICFAAVALLVGCVFMRSSGTMSGTGVIRGKEGRGGGNYQQQQVGIERGFRGSTSIPIAPSYSFEVAIDGESEPGFYSLPVDAAAAFEVGQRVRVDYVVRGTSPLWTKTYVTNMEAIH